MLPDGRPGEYLTDRLTDEAVRFMTESRDKPFFLYFPHYGVHTPLQAREEMVARYEQIPKRQRQGDPVYAAMVESIDQSVGRVLSTLDATCADREYRCHFHFRQRRVLEGYKQRTCLRARQGCLLRKVAASVYLSLSNGRVSLGRASSSTNR